jgi:hypothetical protein
MNTIFGSRIKTGVCGTLLAVTLLVGANSSEAALGIDFTGSVASGGMVENGGPTTFGSPSGFSIVGWSFKPTVDLYLTRLGVYDADRDRLHSEQHQVGIWSANNSTSPLASVIIDESAGNVPETSPQGAKFHFANTAAPVMLTAGQTYFVGATMYAGLLNGSSTTTDFDSFASFNNGDSPVFLNQYINYLGSAYAINGSNTLSMPTTAFITDYAVGANIDVTPTPIPAAAWLLGSGLLGLVGIRRRS